MSTTFDTIDHALVHAAKAIFASEMLTSFTLGPHCQMEPIIYGRRFSYPDTLFNVMKALGGDDGYIYGPPWSFYSEVVPRMREDAAVHCVVVEAIGLYRVTISTDKEGALCANVGVAVLNITDFVPMAIYWRTVLDLLSHGVGRPAGDLNWHVLTLKSDDPGWLGEIIESVPRSPADFSRPSPRVKEWTDTVQITELIHLTYQAMDALRDMPDFDKRDELVRTNPDPLFRAWTAVVAFRATGSLDFMRPYQDSRLYEATLEHRDTAAWKAQALGPRWDPGA